MNTTDVQCEAHQALLRALYGGTPYADGCSDIGPTSVITQTSDDWFGIRYADQTQLFIPVDGEALVRGCRCTNHALLPNEKVFA